MENKEFFKRWNWFAIQTKPAQEDQAAANIRQLSLEVFMPQVKQVKRSWGKTLVKITPLFPRYLFANFAPLPYLHPIRYARGVTRVISAGDDPLPLDKKIIELIQQRIGEDGFVILGPTTLKTGDPVMISEGPLQGLEGVFERESSRDRVIILLQAAEYQARVYVEKQSLRTQTC